MYKTSSCWSSLSRYLTLSGLRVSTIPILPDNNELINTPLGFYYPKLNKTKQRTKIAQYCATLMNYLNTINMNKNKINGEEYNIRVEKLVEEQLLLVNKNIENEEKEVIKDKEIMDEMEGEQIEDKSNGTEMTFPVDRNIKNEKHSSDEYAASQHKDIHFQSRGIKLLEAAHSLDESYNMTKLDDDLYKFAEASKK